MAERVPADTLGNAGTRCCGPNHLRSRLSGQYGCSPFLSGLPNRKSASWLYGQRPRQSSRAPASAVSIGNAFPLASVFRLPTTWSTIARTGRISAVSKQTSDHFNPISSMGNAGASVSRSARGLPWDHCFDYHVTHSCLRKPVQNEPNPIPFGFRRSSPSGHKTVLV